MYVDPDLKGKKRRIFAQGSICYIESHNPPFRIIFFPLGGLADKMLEVFFLAVALSMDAFAVSIGLGAKRKKDAKKIVK